MAFKPVETKWHSWRVGKLCKGCSLCVLGRKLVIFITGICSQKCFYCPISERKYGNDVVFANEWQVKDSENPRELFEEAELTEAKGAGITGGDPLSRLDRCCKYIKLLKQKFGNDFHIHLYTSLKLVTRENLQELYDAGLDEIRFHPDLDDDSLWQRIELAREFGWAVGVEIPVIPGYESKTKKLIDFIASKIDFLNLNELELSDTEISHYKLGDMDFAPKDDISYGVAGSEELAKKLLLYAADKDIAVHYCTSQLKNCVQVLERLKLRAKNVAYPFEKVTSTGTILRCCIYLKGLEPGADYQQRLAQFKDAKQALEQLKSGLIKLGLSKHKIFIDAVKLRIIIPLTDAIRLLGKLKQKGFVVASVEEMPTHDALEIEVDFLTPIQVNGVVANKESF